MKCLMKELEDIEIVLQKKIYDIEKIFNIKINNIILSSVSVRENLFVALKIAKARDLKGKDFNVIVVIGDNTLSKECH